MRISFATIPARPDRDNEDFFVATSTVAVLLDGAGTPTGSGDGCVHGVAWFAHELGLRCLDAAAKESTSLTDSLRTAIKQVAAMHEDRCDLSHPGSPSSTVILLREQPNSLEYLVLADSVLVVSGKGGTSAITDNREAAFADRYRPSAAALGAPSQSRDQAIKTFVEKLRDYRNREGGFWVASSDPGAANHALTGVISAEDARSVALLSDGASRPVDRFDLATWDQALEELVDEGPAHWLHRVRQAELSDPQGQRWPRTKVSDDATAALAIPDWG